MITAGWARKAAGGAPAATVSAASTAHLALPTSSCRCQLFTFPDFDASNGAANAVGGCCPVEATSPGKPPPLSGPPLPPPPLLLTQRIGSIKVLHKTS